MSNLKNERRGGCYWTDQPYLSVTNILSVIDRPSLRYWFGQQVYLAVVANPSLNEQEALSAPYKVSDKAKDRGTTVHSIVEAYKAGVFDIDDKVMDEYTGYAKAFKAWVTDMKPEILENEKTIFSPLGYAGTLDMLAKIGGVTTIVDIKTGKDIYPEANLQVSAYLEALRDTKGDKVASNGSILLLMPTGHYKYQQANDEFKAFMACKTLYEGLNREKLEKIGYKLFNK